MAYGPVFAVYTAVTAVLIATVFYWKVFPVCFVEGEGLTHFIRELRGSLADRRRRLGEDGRVMSKTLSHVNEILHLQRRYARESGPGPGTDRLDMAELIDDAPRHAGGGPKEAGDHRPPALPARTPRHLRGPDPAHPGLYEPDQKRRRSPGCAGVLARNQRMGRRLPAGEM